MSKILWDIVKDILNSMKFFVDENDRYEVYAEYKKDDGTVHFHPIRSRDFEATLRILYRHYAGQDQNLNIETVSRYIEDEAIYFEKLEKVEPHCRLAGTLRSGIEYFLADKGKTVVDISNGEWKVTAHPRHRFLTTASHLQQVSPKACEKNVFDLLAPCINLTGDDLTLFVIWLIQGFSGGSHYGVMLSAERGSGKSTLTKLVSTILDPSKVDAALLQTKLEDFQTFLANHYLACFDNVRSIPVDFSDTLAAAITGSTVAKRKLYSNRDVVYLTLHNLVLINGIGIFPNESDLAERFLYFNLKKIDSKHRKTDGCINQYIETNRAKILGAIFEVLAKATEEIHKTHPENPTRMATSYTEMLAIAKVLGVTEKEFDKILHHNIDELHRACAATPLVEAICEYMNGPQKGRRKVSCSSTEFFNQVRANYTGSQSALPSRAAEFSKRLKAEKDALLAAGFQSIVDDTGATRSIITVIRESK